MNTQSRIIVAMGLALTMVACGGKPPAPTPQTSAAPAAPPATPVPADKLFEPQRGVLDKARGVGQADAKGADAGKQEAEQQTK
jgi:hypothetical protein